jgi:hypothetical protein
MSGAVGLGNLGVHGARVHFAMLADGREVSVPLAWLPRRAIVNDPLQLKPAVRLVTRIMVYSCRSARLPAAIALSGYACFRACTLNSP